MAFVRPIADSHPDTQTGCDVQHVCVHALVEVGRVVDGVTLLVGRIESQVDGVTHAPLAGVSVTSRRSCRSMSTRALPWRSVVTTSTTPRGRRTWRRAAGARRRGSSDHCDPPAAGRTRATFRQSPPWPPAPPDRPLRPTLDPTLTSPRRRARGHASDRAARGARSRRTRWPTSRRPRAVGHRDVLRTHCGARGCAPRHPRLRRRPPPALRPTARQG